MDKGASDPARRSLAQESPENRQRNGAPLDGGGGGGGATKHAAAAAGMPCGAGADRGNLGVAAGTVRRIGNEWEATDPKQVKTAAVLARHVPEAKTAYLGALYALQQDEYPDRPAHAAHSLREVIDLLARSRQTDNERKAPLEHKRRKAMLQAAFDPLALREPRVDHVSDELTSLYRRLSKIAHHGSTDADDLVCMLSRLEEALDALDAPQLTVNKEMDDILSRPPSKKLAVRLTGMQHRWATSIRLAENLPVEWLPHMREAGYFSEPQPADASDRRSYAIWPASLYLRRCTGRFGAEITEIILTAKFRREPERNPAVYADFLACACALPLPDAERIAAKALGEGWADFGDIIVYDKGYLELAGKLYLGGRHCIAANLLLSAMKAKMLEASGEDEGRSGPRPYAVPADAEWFARELREAMLPLAESSPWPVMEMLGRFLDEVDKLDAQKERQADKDGGEPDAASALLDCRPDSDNVMWSIFRRQMVDFVTAFTIECIKNHVPRTPDGMGRLRGIMAEFYKRGHSAFRRIELSAYAEFPAEFRCEAGTAALLYFDREGMRDEHLALLGASFGHLSVRARQEVLRIIDAGPSQDRLGEIAAYHGADWADAAEKRWKLTRLHQVKDHLEGERLAAYQSLRTEMGEPEQPGRALTITKFQNAGREAGSPLAGKSAGQAFEYMREHGDSVDEFFERGHMGTDFEEYAKSNPEECSKRAYEARTISPAALRYMVSGLDGALRDGRNIDWDGALRLIEHTVATGRPHGREPAEPALLLAMCGLIERGLKRDLIDIDMRERVWNTIEALVGIGTECAEDAPARRQRRRGVEVVRAVTDKRMAEPAKMAPLDASLDGIDGMSFHAVYQYAAWCGRHGKVKDGFGPKARRVFDTYLDNGMGPHSAARHAVLGVFFPGFYQLDREWAEGLPRRIATGREAKAAFWEAYVVWNDLHPHVFKDLFPLYREFSKKGAMQSSANRRSSGFTIIHVMLAHLYDMDGADDPLGNLLDGSDETLRECARQIGIIMMDKAGDPDFDKERLAALWRNPGLARHDLGMWLVDSPLDKKDTIALYRDHVAACPGGINLYIALKHLVPYARDFPGEVAECLDVLVGKCHGYVPDPVRDVLVLLRGSGDEAVKEKCRAIDEKLAQRGREWGP